MVLYLLPLLHTITATPKETDMLYDNRTLEQRKKDAQTRASLNWVSSTLRRYGLIGRPNSPTAEYRRDRAVYENMRKSSK